MFFSFAHYLAYKKIVDNNSELEEIYDIKFIIALSVFVLAMMGIMIVGYSYTWLRYTILLVMVIVLFKNKTEILGNRMHPVTLTTPKPLVRVNGIRMIDTVIDGLHKNGIHEIYVSIVAAFPIGAVIVMITASFMKDAKKYMENLEEGKIRNKK